MKKRFYAALMVLVIGMLACLLTAPTYAYGTGKAVYLDEESLTMHVGEKKTVTMYVGGSASFAEKWSSSNKKVATVSKKGVVTAKKAGKATITCKTGFGFNIKCKVTVKKATLNPKSVTMYVGNKKTVTMYVNGSATSAKKWSSSNKKVATVSKKGVITAKKAGKATITCKTGFGYNLKCKVTVKKRLELSGYLNKNYKKLAKKVPEAKHVNKKLDPAEIGNLYDFETSTGTVLFFRYNKKTKKIDILQISDDSPKRCALYGISVGMTAKKAKAILKAKKLKYCGSKKYDIRTCLTYKKGGHTLVVSIMNGKVEYCTWTR